MSKVPSTILGACGEHYVASYLSGMGLVAALTRRGVPATDLIVTSEMGRRVEESQTCSLFRPRSLQKRRAIRILLRGGFGSRKRRPSNTVE